MIKHLATAMIVGGLVLSGTAAYAEGPTPQNYKAHRDFSYNNPGGVWSYGYGTAGDRESFVRYSVGLTTSSIAPIDSFYDSESSVGVNTSGKTTVLRLSSSSIVHPANALLMHPRSDNQETIVVFTTPARGFYKIEGFFEILDNLPTSIRPRILIGSKDQTRKAFGSEVDVVLSGASNPDKKKVGEKRTFSFTRELSQNQRVQFSVNPNGDWRFDSTGFDVTITPVPTP